MQHSTLTTELGGTTVRLETVTLATTGCFSLKVVFKGILSPLIMRLSDFKSIFAPK